MLGLLRKPVLTGLMVALGVLCIFDAGHRASAAPARVAAASLRGGLNITGVDYGASPARADADITWAHRLHASVVRVEVPWSVMEPATSGVLDERALAYTDRLMSDAAAAHIGVVAMVESTPCWASSAPARLRAGCSPRRSSLANAWPPSQPGDFAKFVSFLAERYKSSLTAIEIWNEPDQINEHYFAGPEKPKRYAALLRAAYPAIKQVAPGVLVLAGSLVGPNGVFLRALYTAGIKGYYDGLAVHFYTLTLASLRAIHEVQLANGDQTPLWLNEFGWSSCWPRFKVQQEQACVTRQLQGSNLASLIRSLARTPYVAAAIVYKLQGNLSEDFGVLNANGSRKPAFAALASALASPGTGSAGNVTLQLHRTAAGVLASGSGPPGDFMRIEAFSGSLLRYRAFFTLDRFNRYSLRLPSVLGASGLSIRVFQYWKGPATAARRAL